MLPPYEIEWRLEDRNDVKPLVVSGLVPDADTGYLTVYIDASQLTPGRYYLRVRNPENELSIDSRFTVRVVGGP